MTLKVFLYFLEQDEKHPKLEPLISSLRTVDGIELLLEDTAILPGQNSRVEIKRKFKESDLVIFCYSLNFQKPGVHHAIRKVLLDEVAVEKGDGLFYIPIKLEECDILTELDLKILDYFDINAFEKLFSSLKVKAAELNIIITPITPAESLGNLLEELQKAEAKEDEDKIIQLCSAIRDLQTKRLLEIYLGKANALLKEPKPKYAEIIKYLSLALTLTPNLYQIEIFKLRSQSYLGAIKAKELYGSYNLAIDDLDKALELDPKNPELYSLRGTAYREKGFYEKALENFTFAINLAPENKEYYFLRGLSHYELARREHPSKEYHHCIEDLKKAIGDTSEFDPAVQPAYYEQLSLAYEYSNDETNAKKFKKFFRIKKGLLEKPPEDSDSIALQIGGTKGGLNIDTGY
jgi:tetratricopeptide (TPR) repeat protein